ncbi:MAG: hypothetical protein HZB16_18055 [Armatimonadetes bacterium]|nr:hypothetical protein [Armatimonadota bacterium]
MESAVTGVTLPLGVRVLLWLIGVLFALLPLFAGLCFRQVLRCRDRGDEPLARSWADATRSFVGMTLASWCLTGVGMWCIRAALAYLDSFRRG